MWQDAIFLYPETETMVYDMVDYSFVERGPFERDGRFWIFDGYEKFPVKYYKSEELKSGYLKRIAIFKQTEKPLDSGLRENPTLS